VKDWHKFALPFIWPLVDSVDSGLGSLRRSGVPIQLMGMSLVALTPQEDVRIGIQGPEFT
jgi:hypothetical protein